MLILSRKLNESIIIDGQIVVKILRIDRDTVKLGIQAPAQLPVHRQAWPDWWTVRVLAVRRDSPRPSVRASSR